MLESVEIDNRRGGQRGSFTRPDWVEADCVCAYFVTARLCVGRGRLAKCVYETVEPHRVASHRHRAVGGVFGFGLRAAICSQQVCGYKVTRPPMPVGVSLLTHWSIIEGMAIVPTGWPTAVCTSRGYMVQHWITNDSSLNVRHGSARLRTFTPASPAGVLSLCAGCEKRRRKNDERE